MSGHGKSGFHGRFEEGVKPCFVCVSGVHQLFAAVEKVRAEVYQQTRDDHEEVLMQVRGPIVQLPNPPT